MSSEVSAAQVTADGGRRDGGDQMIVGEGDNVSSGGGGGRIGLSGLRRGEMTPTATGDKRRIDMQRELYVSEYERKPIRFSLRAGNYCAKPNIMIMVSEGKIILDLVLRHIYCLRRSRT